MHRLGYRVQPQQPQPQLQHSVRIPIDYGYAAASWMPSTSQLQPPPHALAQQQAQAYVVYNEPATTTVYSSSNSASTSSLAHLHHHHNNNTQPDVSSSLTTTSSSSTTSPPPPIDDDRMSSGGESTVASSVTSSCRTVSPSSDAQRRRMMRHQFHGVWELLLCLATIIFVVALIVAHKKGVINGAFWLVSIVTASFLSLAIIVLLVGALCSCSKIEGPVKEPNAMSIARQLNAAAGTKR